MLYFLIVSAPYKKKYGCIFSEFEGFIICGWSKQIQTQKYSKTHPDFPQHVNNVAKKNLVMRQQHLYNNNNKQVFMAESKNRIFGTFYFTNCLTKVQLIRK